MIASGAGRRSSNALTQSCVFKSLVSLYQRKRSRPFVPWADKTTSGTVVVSAGKALRLSITMAGSPEARGSVSTTVSTPLINRSQGPELVAV